MKKITTLLALVLSTSAMSEVGDNYIHMGAMNLNPDDSENKVLAKTPLGNVETGLSASIEDATTFGLGYSRMVTDNFAVGFQIGVPPKHDLTRGSDGVKVGEVEQISPEIKAEYYFGTDGDTFRPFVGGGIAFMSFEGEVTDAETQQVLGTKVNVDSGIAPVVSFGANAFFNENFFVRGSLSYLFYDTSVSFPDAVAVKAGQAEKIFADADVNPLIVYLALGYKF